MGISLSAFALSLTLAAPAELAFTSDTGIFSLKADGSGRVPIVLAPKGEFLTDAAWSPDGARLLYTQGGEDDSRLMITDTAGTHEITPKQANTSDVGPAWSPDGRTVAFMRFSTSKDSLTTYIITRDLATGAERAVVTQKWDNRGSTVGAPAYSPDGATIAYTHSRYDRNVDSLPEIRTIPAQGGAAKTLIKRAEGLTYSPDGTRVAYASITDRNGQRCGSDTCAFAGELYVANADGTQPRRLTKDEGDISVPRWSPDGSRILFSSDRNLPDGSSAELYSIGADGSCLTWLTNGLGATSPAWRPGSGDSFTADCDPKARPVTYTPPKMTNYRGNLWLGAKPDGLLLDQVNRRTLFYTDCERFSGCPAEAVITAGDACTQEYAPYIKLSVRKGWLVADYGGDNSPVVYGGALVTRVPPHVLDDLRTLRPEKPRIPRSFVAALTAAQKAKLKPYRPC